ncbi:hypothetical protein D3C84_1263940 [compost metagenome]
MTTEYGIIIVPSSPMNKTLFKGNSNLLKAYDDMALTNKPIVSTVTTMIKLLAKPFRSGDCSQTSV